MPTMPKRTEPSLLPSSADWRQVDPDSLPADWPKYAPLVRRALMAGEGSYNERDVMYGLLGGSWQFWALGDPVESICITEIVQFPRQRKLLIRYISGQWEHFAENLSLVLDYARHHGCNRVEAYMRYGLIRKLPADWKARHVFMVKELD